jgi:hypothetical protein
VCVCGSSPPSGTILMSAVVKEMQGQLIAREEVNSREGAITTLEDELEASEHALEKACMECNAECTQNEAVRQDSYTR